jgi:hypothetical protein
MREQHEWDAGHAVEPVHLPIGERLELGAVDSTNHLRSALGRERSLGI